MITVYAWQLRDARSNATAELRRVENVLASSRARDHSDKFVNDAMLTLSKDLHEQWNASYKLDTKRSSQWFWQVGSDDVAAWNQITEGCREIVHLLWFVEQGLLHMLPDDFVARMNEKPAAKPALQPGQSALILQFPGPKRRANR